VCEALTVSSPQQRKATLTLGKPRPCSEIRSYEEQETPSPLLGVRGKFSCSDNQLMFDLL